jgi:hypothetical protein
MPTIGRYIITVTAADVGNVVFTPPITVKRIHILGTGATVAGHAYRLEDPNGELLYRSQANGAFYESESITQRQWKGGIKVITLDSGAIDIEYESQGETKY